LKTRIEAAKKAAAGATAPEDKDKEDKEKDEAEETTADAQQASEDVAEVPDPDLDKLLEVSPKVIWRHLGRMTHRDAVQQFGQRMVRGMQPMDSTGNERIKIEEPKPSTLEFLRSAVAALGESDPECESKGPPEDAPKSAPDSKECPGAESPSLEAAKLFALRCVAEGRSMSLPSATALRLYLSSGGADSLHARCNAALTALCSNVPLSNEQEALVPFVTQLELGLEALPSQRGTQFLGLNFSTSSGTLSEVLKGEIGNGSFYPGGLLLWRGCTSVTSDPMLAKKLAQGEKGVALVLKIRSNTSRDVSAFAPASDLGERLFPPRRFFRVSGIFALTDMELRSGLAMSGHVHSLLEAFGTPDLSRIGGGSALSWEDACGRRAACVVLDEEEQAPTSAL